MLIFSSSSPGKLTDFNTHTRTQICDDNVGRARHELGSEGSTSPAS